MTLYLLAVAGCFAVLTGLSWLAAVDTCHQQLPIPWLAQVVAPTAAFAVLAWWVVL